MDFYYILFLMIIGLGFLGFILFLMLKKRLRERYALIWLFFALAVVFLPFFYPLLIWFNAYIDLPHTTLLLISLLIVGLTIISLQLTVAISSLWKKQKELIQHIAILEQKMKEKE